MFVSRRWLAFPLIGYAGPLPTLYVCEPSGNRSDSHQYTSARRAAQHSVWIGLAGAAYLTQHKPNVVVISSVNVIVLACLPRHVFLCLYGGTFAGRGRGRDSFSERIMLNYSKPFNVKHTNGIWNSLFNVFLVDIQNI